MSRYDRPSHRAYMSFFQREKIVAKKMVARRDVTYNSQAQRR
jgi:hypothetical protein